MIASNIETILNREEVSNRYSELTNGESIPNVDTSGITLAAQIKHVPEVLKSFIGVMYIPRTIEEMMKVLPLYPFIQYDELATTFSYITSFCYPFDMDSRIDRYSLARVFSIVGEHSNNISGLLPQGSHAHSFFASLIP